MATKRVSIVTDGGVELPTELIKKYKIIVIPRKVEIGGRVYKSDIRTTLEMINKRVANSRKPATFLPLHRGHFLDAYRKLHSKRRSIVSIHALGALDSACHYARWARQMLLPDVDAEVFEAKTLDVGVSFLVAAAAAFAKKRRATTEQVCFLLKRLQDKIHTFLITTAPQDLPCHPPLEGRQKLKARLLGVDTLLMLEKDQGTFRPIGQSGNIASQLLKGHQWFRGIEGPCDVQMKHRGYGEQAKALRPQLSRLVKVRDYRLQRAGIEAALLPGKFLEITFLPRSVEVQRIEQMVEKWGRYRYA